MSLGSFGPVVFEVSEKKVRTFDEFKRTTTAKFEEHAVIGKKPLLEFVAPGLDAITFQMVFSVSTGLNPLKEISAIREILAKYQYYPLLIGMQNLGNFVIENISETWRHVDGKGVPLHIAIDVTLKEYIESTMVKTGATGSVVNDAEKINAVSEQVEGIAEKIGLDKKKLPDLSGIALTATKDRIGAVSALEGVMGDISQMQGNVTGIDTTTYQILGINTIDLINKAQNDPGGVIVDILAGLQSGGEDKYGVAKEIYGVKTAGPIMQLAQYAPQIKQVLEGKVTGWA